MRRPPLATESRILGPYAKKIAGVAALPRLLSRPLFPRNAKLGIICVKRANLQIVTQASPLSAACRCPPREPSRATTDVRHATRDFVSV